MDTIKYIVHCYYYQDDGEEARYSYNRFLERELVFENRREKELFECFVLSHQEQLTELT